jgi:hypothetical protein
MIGTSKGTPSATCFLVPRPEPKRRLDGVARGFFEAGDELLHRSLNAAGRHERHFIRMDRDRKRHEREREHARQDAFHERNYSFGAARILRRM